MMPCISKWLRVLIASATLAAMGGTQVAGAAPQNSDSEFEFHSVVPLGMEPIRLEPAGDLIALFASADGPEFEGLRRTGAGSSAELLRADHSRVRHYPRQLTFRVTATKRFLLLPGTDTPFPIETNTALNDFLLGLRFEVKVFNGLEARTLEPISARLIGVPADVPYTERIYRVTFELNDVPISQRVVLEILTPEGDRMCKFNLDLI